MMTNINCSANCIYEVDGKCSLDHISITQNVLNQETQCAYYTPRKNPPEKNKPAK